MQSRLGGVIAVFAGMAVMIGVWIAMSGERVTTPAKGPDAVKTARPVLLEPEVRQINPELIARRQQLITNATGGSTKHGPRARLDPRSRGAIRPPVMVPHVTLPSDVFELDQGGVADAVESRQDDLTACYETALFHSPGLEGKMTLELQLEPGANPKDPWAKVASVQTDSDLDATVFEGCVATVFEELRFDAREPTTVRYPITFAEADPQ